MTRVLHVFKEEGCLEELPWRMGGDSFVTVGVIGPKEGLLDSLGMLDPGDWHS